MARSAPALAAAPEQGGLCVWLQALQLFGTWRHTVQLCVFHRAIGWPACAWWWRQCGAAVTAVGSVGTSAELLLAAWHACRAMGRHAGGHGPAAVLVRSRLPTSVITASNTQGTQGEH